MTHLVQALTQDIDDPIPIADYYHELEKAHRYLLDYAQKALERANHLPLSQSWASMVKRTELQFPVGSRPKYIAPEIQRHNFFEVVNQCATMERLLDALLWAKECLPDYAVLRCHPTTSSNKVNPNANIPDNDLVLINSLGRFARFEVSDIVSSKKDSNGKEAKEILSLGISEATLWSEERLFLVVSAEFAERLRSRSRKAFYRYEESKASLATSIFEILPV